MPSVPVPAPTVTILPRKVTPQTRAALLRVIRAITQREASHAAD